MKRKYLFFAIPLMIVACKSKPFGNLLSTKKDDKVYPFTIEHPDQWKIDTSHANTVTVLKFLKAAEKADTAEMRKCLADSITVIDDDGSFKGPVEKLLTLVSNEGKLMKSIRIKMKDWEAIVSTKNEGQWVITWYTQTIIFKTGKTDSVDYIDNYELKSGKVVRLNEYARHYK